MRKHRAATHLAHAAAARRPRSATSETSVPSVHSAPISRSRRGTSDPQPLPERFLTCPGSCYHRTVCVRRLPPRGKSAEASRASAAGRPAGHRRSEPDRRAFDRLPEAATQAGQASSRRATEGSATEGSAAQGRARRSNPRSSRLGRTMRSVAEATAATGRKRAMPAQLPKNLTETNRMTWIA